MKRPVLKILLPMLALVLAALLPLGCGGSGSGDGLTTGSGTGRLQVALTDARDPGLAELVISISEVRAVPASEEEDAEADELPLLASFDPPLQIDVLDLAYQQELLGEVDLGAGEYHQIRLVLAANDDPLAPANYAVFTADPETVVPVNFPSGQQSGLKIPGDFTVEADALQAVVLDFDPARALVQAGAADKWQFKPTGVRLVRLAEALPEYGALTGAVVVAALDPATGETVDQPVADARVTVFAAETGEEVASSGVNPEDGSFRVFLPNGFYELTIEAPGFETFTSSPQVFEVLEGEETYTVTIELVPAGEPPVVEEGGGGDPVEDPAGDPAEDPAGDPAEDPAGDPAGDPVEDPAGDPVEDPAGDPVPAAPALVRIYLSDMPNPAVAGASFILDDIAAHAPGGGWQNLLSEPVVFEFTPVAGEELLLGEFELPAGKYTQIRFFLSDALVEVDDQTREVEVPSGALRLNRNLELCSGEIELVIDLGARKSLKYKKKGDSYQMRPVLRLADVVSTCSSPDDGGSTGEPAIEPGTEDPADPGDPALEPGTEDPVDPGTPATEPGTEVPQTAV